jgi:hypothetical protein
MLGVCYHGNVHGFLPSFLQMALLWANVTNKSVVLGKCIGTGLKALECMNFNIGLFIFFDVIPSRATELHREIFVLAGSVHIDLLSRIYFMLTPTCLVRCRIHSN